MSRPINKAYNFIKQNILNGDYYPSQKLVENELASEINVSRNTIKKALYKLQEEQLVVIELNKGATVKSYNIDEIVNYFEIREALEVLVIKSVVNLINSDQINELENNLVKMEQCIIDNNFDEYSKTNRTFHELIYSIADNKPAVKMIKIIKNQFLRYHIRTILVPGRTNSSFQEHKNIVEAIKSRDVVKAQNAIQTHINNISKTIKENYKLLL